MWSLKKKENLHFNLVELFASCETPTLKLELTIYMNYKICGTIANQIPNSQSTSTPIVVHRVGNVHDKAHTPYGITQMLTPWREEDKWVVSDFASCEIPMVLNMDWYSTWITIASWTKQFPTCCETPILKHEMTQCACINLNGRGNWVVKAFISCETPSLKHETIIFSIDNL